MGTLNTKIVGLKHRGISLAFVNNISASRIKLVLEPTNKHDKNAVMCIFDGIHFGYIEKEKSSLVNHIVSTSSTISVSIKKTDEFEITIFITFENKSESVTFEKLSNGDEPGIYEISFAFNESRFRYIGQSVHINNRLRQHYRELSRLSHHNKQMQHAWTKDSTKFKCKILDTISPNLSPLHQQFMLFQLELQHIENAGSTSVNAIAGDLVFTEESLVEFDKLIRFLKGKIKDKRKVLAYEKEKISDLILDVGILTRHIISGNEIKSSNVLSWINKVPYSVFDYMPPIVSNHRLYQPLVDALRGQQKKIMECDKNKQYIDQFRTTVVKKKKKYATCEMKSLQKFLKILDTYKSAADPDIVIAQFQSVKKNSIAYDSCLNNILDTKTISLIGI